MADEPMETFDLVTEVEMLIHKIERERAIVRIEADNFKEVYLAGQYRRIGYTKRHMEDKLAGWRGEENAFDTCIRVLRGRIAEVGGDV